MLFARNYQVFPLGSPGGYARIAPGGLFAKRRRPVFKYFLSVGFHPSPSKINEVRFGYSVTAPRQFAQPRLEPEANGLNFARQLGLRSSIHRDREPGAIGYSVPRAAPRRLSDLDNFTWLHGKQLPSSRRVPPRSCRQLQ